MTSRVETPWFGAAAASFAIGDFPILNSVDLNVLPGEIHALVGRQNEGKTTLCNLMAGLAQPSAGRIVAAGTAHAQLTAERARELGVAKVGDDPLVFPRLSIMENLIAWRTGWWLGAMPKRLSRRRILAWLAGNCLTLPVDRMMGDMPRDLWTVVEILARLRTEPRLLILDGALEALEAKWRKPILALVRRGLARGMSVLWVTHQLEDALLMADRISVMRRGRVILTDRAGNLERLNLIRMCYARIEGNDDADDSRERFHELMRYTEAMLTDFPAAVAILDNSLRVRFLNRSGAELFAAAGAGRGMPFAELAGGANPRLVELAGEAVDSGGDAERHSLPVKTAGGIVLADARVRVVRDNGFQVGCMVIIEDVSVREELRRRLTLSENLASVGLLAAGVAHEVNNPLEIIGNYLSFLAGEPLSSDSAKAVTKMEREVGRIQHIVNNLVAYSGGGGAGQGRAELGGLVRELCDLLQPQAKPRRIAFETTGLDTPPLTVLADPEEIRQVFLNLVRNSMDAMPSGGRIRIAAAPRGDKAEVTLADDGPGVQLENPAEIFLPFVTTKKDGGSHQGLGLYVVYGIMERCGGRIAVRNPPGGGCEFTLQFNLAGPGGGDTPRIDPS